MSLFGVSDASALAPFSFSEMPIAYPGRATLLQSLGISDECGSANPGSTINCALTPQDLYDEANEGNLVIHKVDESGRPLAGAKFTIDNVKAMHIGGRYVYSPKFGDFTEFETDETGTIVLAYIPYGDYTIREVSAPTGYKVNSAPTVISVNAETMSEQTYVRNRYLQYQSASSAERNDITESVVKAPGDVIYQLMMADEAAYDEQENGYNIDGMIVNKNSAGNYSFSLGQNTIEMYATSQGNYAALIKGSEIQADAMSILSEDKNTSGILHMESDYLNGGFSEEYIYDSETGCYISSDETEDIAQRRSENFICKENSTYTLYRDEAKTRFMPHTYDQASGKWIYDPAAFYYRFTEIDNNSLAALMGYSIQHEPDLDRYSIWWMVQWLIDIEKENVAINASEVTIANYPVSNDAEAATDENGVESNPQTSDTLTKAACIILMATASAYLMNRKLSRR